MMLLLLTSLFLAPAAQAVLGEPESSIEQVRRATRTARKPGVRQSRGTATYTVHELTHAGGAIREYVNAEGKVFAISWRGYRSPDPKTLLGAYQSEFTALSRRTPRAKGTRGQLLQSNRLVAARAGHPRALRGKFIAPSLMPKGVTVHDIQ